MKDGLPWRERRRRRLEAQGLKQACVYREVGGKRCIIEPYANPTPAPTTRKVAADHNPHLPRGIVPWVLPDKWRGRVFHIVGGGPSLKSQAVMALMKRCAEQSNDVWIVVNNSYKIAPWADILFFADCDWWNWNGEHVLKHWPEPKEIVTATSDHKSVRLPRIRRMWRNRNHFDPDPRKVHGYDGGCMSVSLAYHLGATKIVLWGIDGGPGPDGATQWHKEHKRDTHIPNYAKKFRPHLAAAVRALAGLGVPVVRATEPGIPEAPYEPQAAS